MIWSIGDLEAAAQSLPSETQSLLERIFRVSTSWGRLVLPEGMPESVRDRFRPLEIVANQKVVRVANLVTAEETIFNWMRATRPLVVDQVYRLPEADRRAEADPFCNPLEHTPEDVFGRAVGRQCLTASNISKCEGFHAVLIFHEYDPLCFTREQIADYFETGVSWARQAHLTDPEAKYFFLMWNCLWRAGASVPHGHMQLLLGRDRHYGKVEQLRRAAVSYRERYGGNYFADLYRVHRALGCGFEKEGVRILSYLTPAKEKEVLLLGTGLDRSLEGRVFEVLACYRDRLGVSSFNLAVYMPPLLESEEDWEDFPTLVRIVDRGDPDSRASDIGTMELYAAPVVSSDPFAVARALAEALSG